MWFVLFAAFVYINSSANLISILSWHKRIVFWATIHYKYHAGSRSPISDLSKARLRIPELWLYVIINLFVVIYFVSLNIITALNCGRLQPCNFSTKISDPTIWKGAPASTLVFHQDLETLASPDLHGNGEGALGPRQDSTEPKQRVRVGRMA